MCFREKYVHFLHNRKCSIFFSFLLVNFFITGILVGNNLLGFTEGGNFDWVITDNKISEQNDVLRLAHSKTDELRNVEDISERSIMSQVNSISFIYTWAKDNSNDIFNSKNLQTICKVEKVIFDNKMYKDYCYLQNNNCATIGTSLTNVFYPVNHNWECEKLIKKNLCMKQSKIMRIVC